MKMEAVLFMLTMAGANRKLPQNVKDLKVAELPWSERLENAYIDIQKGFQDLDEKEVSIMIKRVILDYSTGGDNVKLQQYLGEIMKYMLDYLLTHSEERVTDPQKITNSLMDLINEE